MNQTREWLQGLYDENKVPEFAFSGKCHDCDNQVTAVEDGRDGKAVLQM